MTDLVMDWNFGPDGDDIYAALVDAHEGLSEEDGRRLDARLILLLANHIGDADVIREALERASEGLGEAR